MSLSESVLVGVQSWYRSLVKDANHSKRRSSKWIRACARPDCLSSARTLLLEASTRFAGKPALQKIGNLLSAISCAESRDGVMTPDLVESLVTGDKLMSSAISEGDGFSLYEFATVLPGFEDPKVNGIGYAEQTVANSSVLW